MNYTKYLKKKHSLIAELDRVTSAKPIDPDAYNDIVNRLNNLRLTNVLRRRRRQWPALMSCIILMIVLLYIVFEILSLLWIRGSQ